MTTKHTPGPWRKQSNYVMAMVEGRETAIVAIDPTDIPDSQVEANARLIAAAPDLLAATAGLAEWLRDLSEHYSAFGKEIVASGLDVHAQILQRAVARARGEVE